MTLKVCICLHCSEVSKHGKSFIKSSSSLSCDRSIALWDVVVQDTHILVRMFAAAIVGSLVGLDG
jgi:hypothetical protein